MWEWQLGCKLKMTVTWLFVVVGSLSLGCWGSLACTSWAGGPLEELCNNKARVGHHQVLLNSSCYEVPSGTHCTLVGAGNLVIRGPDNSKTTIRCLREDPNQISSAVFSFINATSLHLQNLHFEGCGASLEKEDLRDPFLSPHIGAGQTAALVCSHCSGLLLQNLTFSSTTGYAFVGINLYNESRLDQVQVLGGQGLPHPPLDDPACNQMGREYACRMRGVLLLHADSELSPVTSASETRLTDCLFEGNRFVPGNGTNMSPYRAFCVRDVFEEFIHPRELEISGPLPDVGALTVAFLQTGFQARVSVINSTFSHNQGECFGAVFVLLTPHSADLGSQRIEGCRFINNSPSVVPQNAGKNYLGSDVTVYMEYKANYTEEECLVIEKSFFRNRYATQTPSITVVHFPDTQGKCTVILREVSTNIAAKLLYASGLTRRDTLDVTLEDVVMDASASSRQYHLKGLDQNNGLIMLISIDNATLRGTSQGSCQFNRLLGPVILTRSTELFLTGEILFANLYASNGASGAAIFLESSSTLWLQEPLWAEFCNNSAVSGGAISSVQLVDEFCIFQFLTLHAYADHNISEIDMHLNFSRNSAHVAGNSIYLPNLYNCSARLSAGLRLLSNVRLAYDSIFSFHDETKNHLLEVSSTPSEICFCEGEPTDTNLTSLNCARDSLHTKTMVTYPGREFTLSVLSVDEIYNPVFTSAYNRLVPGTGYGPLPLADDNDFPWRLGYGQDLVKLYGLGNCTQLNFSVLVVNSLEHNWEGILTMYPYGEVECLALPIRLTPCPPGFRLTPEGGCFDCIGLLSKNGFDCEVNSGLVMRPNRNVWAGVVWSNTGEHWRNETWGVGEEEEWWNWENTSSDVVMGYSSNCPFTYCSTVLENISLTNDSALCNQNRRGVLCGQCQENLSLMVGHTEGCGHCSNLWLLTIPLYGLAGVVLVSLLFLLRLTVASGTINGLIFYANVLSFKTFHFLGFKSTSWLYVFISFLNLSLGFPVCLYDGLTMLISTYLGFVVPLYLWSLVLLFIFLSRHSQLLARLTSHSAVPVLATIIHLSFSKLLVMSVSGLSGVVLEMQPASRPGDNDTSIVTPQKWVWFYDGSVDYLHGAHMGLFLLSLVSLLCFIVPYTVFLTGIKIFVRFGLTHRLRPFVDAFCAPYKDRWRYWFGLRLLVIILLNVGFSSLRNLPEILTLFQTMLLTMFTLWQVAVMPYKSVFLNYLDLFFLVDSVLLNIMALFGRDLEVAANVFVIPAFLAFCFIVGYHVYLVLGGEERFGGLVSRVRERGAKRFGYKKTEMIGEEDHSSTGGGEKHGGGTGGSGSGGSSERSHLNSPHATYSTLVVNNPHSIHHYNPGELREPLIESDSENK